METATNPDWDVAKIKLQPQSIEAERSVLGALLISSDSWDGVAEVEIFIVPNIELSFARLHFWLTVVSRLMSLRLPIAC
jgi:hypothetical protein